jgi:endonuclease III-like uncharacterized protein
MFPVPVCGNVVCSLLFLLSRQALSKREPVYQALWAQNTDFDEVLISPVMIQDHMPDKVLDALNKVRSHRAHPQPDIYMFSDQVN